VDLMVSWRLKKWQCEKKEAKVREDMQQILEGMLFDRLCSKGILKEAFKEVKRNRGAAGIDNITIDNFEQYLEENTRKLQQELTTWEYKPKPVRRVEIPKPNGGVRLLGIPCVRDRVVQAAIKMLLEPIFEPQFSEHSYGFRPGRNQQQAVQAAKKIVSAGKEYVVDIDLAQFFDTIHHDRLITRMGQRVDDKRILKIIGMALRSGVMTYEGNVEATDEGSVQGSPLSPLLSNIVLDELDKELEARGLEFCRYADDCNIFVASRDAAKRVMVSVSKFITNKLKLTVNTEKSKVARAHQVKFLGMTIVGLALAISLTSMNRAMAKVKELTPRGTCVPLEKTIERINKWYIGWANYYKMTEYPTQLMQIEAHIRRRLRARIITQKKNNRNLFQALCRRGVTRKQAAIAAYTNKGKWAKSHFRGVERAYPNKWFIEEKGLRIITDKQLSHWKDRKEWVNLS
jgi:RNA-directed DNA polymerase